MRFVHRHFLSQRKRKFTKFISCHKKNCRKIYHNKTLNFKACLITTFKLDKKKHYSESPVTDDIMTKQSRKSTVWSREKISSLIQMYRKHECLWNHYIEGYKSKERRARAIGEICTALRITKFDFGKKVHNLRNQFNSEMKKLERRIDEAGGNINDLSVDQRCRWEHFESLMFLRTVIEPRPGGYQAGMPPEKKFRFKYEYATEEPVEQFMSPADAASEEAIAAESVAQYHYEETADDVETLEEHVATDEFHSYEEEVPTSEREEVYEEKFTSSGNTMVSQDVTITTLPMHSVPSNAYISRQHHYQQNHSQQQAQQEIIQVDDTQHITHETVIEHSGSITDSPPRKKGLLSNGVAEERDQWDAFGELIASELRNYNSDMSRKKLKRRIMHAMLEVGEEDDDQS